MTLHYSASKVLQTYSLMDFAALTGCLNQKVFFVPRLGYRRVQKHCHIHHSLDGLFADDNFLSSCWLFLFRDEALLPL